jgi:hypothetical protein
MRRLIPELAYEKPIASGRYRYARQGRATGAIENWALSQTPEGFFLRVDLDAQEAASGASYLFHLTLDGALHPQRLAFRWFAPGRDVSGNVLFDDERITQARLVNGTRLEMEIEVTPGYLFWFPATAGLSLLAGAQPEPGRRPALTLRGDDDFALLYTVASYDAAADETITVMGEPQLTRVRTLLWQDERRRMWIDAYDWPVRMERNDLVATEIRYLRYRQEDNKRNA